jgi:hypothetical protein
MAFYHRLIDTETWNNLTDNCCSRDGHKQVCDFMGASQFCNELAESAYYDATYGINPYNIYDECYYTDNGTYRCLLTESQYHNIKLRHKSFSLYQRTKLFIQMGHRTDLNQYFKF